MSDSSSSPSPFYVVGGTLGPGTPSYITREADEELYGRLLAGDFCYVLTARQMGKSSLMASTARRLKGDGVRTAIVDLTQIGTERGATEANQWYFGVAHEIHRWLGLAEPLRPWWKERTDLPALQRLTGFFRELVLTYCPGKVVVFVDEIDSTIGLPYASDFFAAIRACYNARAIDPAFARLTFVLLGVASPDQLIQDPTRTPFNVGYRIDLTDFTIEEAHTLATGLHSEGEVATRRLERVFYWTEGHPYLTQSLCRAVEEKSAEPVSPEALVDPLVKMLFLSSLAQREETNLKHARTRLTHRGIEGRRLLRLYLRICEGQHVWDEPTSPLFAQLKLSGVVEVRGDGRLVVRNRIYEAVFTPQWAKSAMPVDRWRQVAAVSSVLSFMLLLLGYSVVEPVIYVRQIQESLEDYRVAAQAYDRLHANLFSRSRADELMAEFWDRRAQREASREHRDESLLYWLKAIETKDTQRRRREAQALVGKDYEALIAVFRGEGVAVLPLASDGRSATIVRALRHVKFWREPRELGRAAIEKMNNTKILDFILAGDNLVTVDSTGHVERIRAMTGETLGEFDIGNYQLGLANISQDGRLMLITGGGIELWDLSNHSSYIKAMEGNFLASTFSFNSRLAIFFRGRNLELWSVAGEEESSVDLTQNSWIDSLAFRPDGRALAIGDGTGCAQIWKRQVVAGDVVRLCQVAMVNSVNFSPDGRMLITTELDGTARLWDLSSSRREVLVSRSMLLPSAFLSEPRNVKTDSKVVELAGGSVRSIDESLLASITDSSQLRRVAFAGGGHYIWVVRSGGSVQRWNYETKLPSGLATISAGDSRLLTLSPNGKMLAYMNGSRVEIWDLGRNKKLSDSIDAFILSDVKFSPDGKLLAVEGDSHVQVFQVDTGRKLFSIDVPKDEKVSSVAFALDNKKFLLGTLNDEKRVSRLSVFDAVSGANVNSGHLCGTSFISLIALSPDKRMSFCGGDSSEGLLISRSDGKSEVVLRHEERQGTDDYFRDIAFFGDGNFVVFTSRWAHYFEMQNQRPILKISRYLHGSWSGSFRLSRKCSDCLEIALGYSDSVLIDTLNFNDPTDLPIQGNPKQLLAKWQKVLALKFDEDMNIVRDRPEAGGV